MTELNGRESGQIKHRIIHSLCMAAPQLSNNVLFFPSISCCVQNFWWISITAVGIFTQACMHKCSIFFLVPPSNVIATDKKLQFFCSQVKDAMGRDKSGNWKVNSSCPHHFRFDLSAHVCCFTCRQHILNRQVIYLSQFSIFRYSDLALLKYSQLCLQGVLYHLHEKQKCV